MSGELKSIDLSFMSREQLERLVMVQLRIIEEQEELLTALGAVEEEQDA
ncbi:hypothetical protein [Enterobacter phage SDFMU_EhYP]|uniref:Uncharacterized protein n=1 Tax=Enterobacter phage SDFMU_EhYP TaxID=3076128 RepID=A0AA96KS34_9CAUD|nr:hypothetical protein [Enterobacter phage SDFMU_EhYP]